MPTNFLKLNDTPRVSSLYTRSPLIPAVLQRSITATNWSSPNLGDVLRCAMAIKKLGISRSSFMAKQDPKSKYYDPTMAPKIKLGLRSVGYFESDLDAWLMSQVAKTAGDHK